MNKRDVTEFFAALFLLLILVFVGLSLIPAQQGDTSIAISKTERLYLIGVPEGDAVFSVHNGTWTVRIAGDNPDIVYSSSSFADVEQWAINQTRQP